MRTATALSALCTLPFLLCACTDVRGRLSPDVLAVTLHADGSAAFSARCAQQEQPLSAHAESPLMLCTALQAASGKAIDAGHISLLCLDGNPAALLPDYLAVQVLMPTAEVLWYRNIPHTLPDPDMLRAAVSAGMLPARTAGCILGDLQNGSGVSALPAEENGSLTLALCDTDGICGMLSPECCRGLALLGGRYEHFELAAGENTVSVLRMHCRISAAETDGTLHFSLHAAALCQPEGIPADGWRADAEQEITALLHAACTLPAHTAGADLLLLRETAVRDGIPQAAACSQSEWRSRLQTAAFDISVDIQK